jgi:hypothetical protein
MPEESKTPTHPAHERMRLIVEALATEPEAIRARMLAASRHFPERSQMRTHPEQDLWLRIGAALVEGGPEGYEGEPDDDDLHVAESLPHLSEERLAEIACDMLALYELVACLRTDDPYSLKPVGPEE